MSDPLEDYAVLGDCHTVALLSRSGSIDWLCLPHFDSSACFSALLGTPEHGRWLLAPSEGIISQHRQYLPGTLIIQSQIITDTGAIEIVDFMPIRDKHPHFVRLLQGTSGEVAMHMEFTPRFHYGSIRPSLFRTPEGVRAEAGTDCLHLMAPVSLTASQARVTADFTISEGKSIAFHLRWGSAVEQGLPTFQHARDLLSQTKRFWEIWIDRSTYRGPYKEAVDRSLLTLKALTYAPTGGIVAAPTTSIPERSGGSRNWDYRFCWLRDSTFTLYALMRAGFEDEAREWRKWLLRSLGNDPSQIQIMYGISGQRTLHEREIPWLPGYANSSPVRVGNAAYQQNQLDVFGELIDTLYTARHIGIAGTSDEWELQNSLLSDLEKIWHKPDKGIWEVRGPERHFTYSKVMAWVAFDRAIRTAEENGLKGSLRRWKSARQEIHRQVCTEAFNPELNSFVQYYGSREMDASLLLIPLVGFLPPKDPKVEGTLSAVMRELMNHGLVMRYKGGQAIDGLAGNEGAFLACSFWLVDNLKMQGRNDESQDLFERLLALRTDLGLLSEQYDPKAQRLMGNFPQAFSHVALINSAFNLQYRTSLSHRGEWW